jgi:hypothetical protein
MAQLELENEGGDRHSSLALPNHEVPAPLHFLVGAGGKPGAELTATRPPGFLASMLLVADRWVVLAPPGDTALAVNRVAVVGFRVLEHGDVIELPGLRLRLSEEHAELLAAGSRLLEQQRACPVCQRDFAPGDRVIYCPRCHLPHHAGGSPQHEDCWSWSGKCASRPFCGYHPRGTAPAPEAAR